MTLAKPAKAAKEADQDVMIVDLNLGVLGVLREMFFSLKRRVPCDTTVLRALLLPLILEPEHPLRELSYRA